MPTPAASSPKKTTYQELTQLREEALLLKAKEAFEQGRFKEAVDFYKILFKREGVTYFDSLVQSYEKLAQQREQSGLLHEAQTIRNHLRSLQQKEKYSAKQGLLPSQKKAAQPYSAPVLESKAAFSEADQLVLGATANISRPSEGAASPHEIQASASTAPYTKELAAICTALKAIPEQNYAGALASCKKIPRKSIFSEWRLLIKGMVAYYQGDDPKALEAFEALTPCGVPFQAAKAFIQILNPTSTHPVLSTWEFLDLKSSSTTLMQANSLWVSGKHWASFQALRNTIPAFPSDQGPLAVLTDFYFKSPLVLLNLPALERYMKPFIDIFTHNSADKKNGKTPPKNPTEIFRGTLLIARYAETLLQTAESHGDSLEIVWEAWSNFLDFAKVRSEFPLSSLEAVVWAHYGELLQEIHMSDPASGFRSRRRRSRDPGTSGVFTLAVRAFETAMKSDPENPEHGYALLDIFAQTDRKKESNQLLEKLIRLFPHEKKPLIQAGITAIRRGACDKGVSYLEQAKKLDPTDPAVRKNLANAYLHAARAAFQRGQTEKGRSFYQKAISQSRSRSWDLEGHPAAIRARWAAMELQLPSSQNAQPSLSSNPSQDPSNEKEGLHQLQAVLEESHWPYWYFADLFGRIFLAPELPYQEIRGKIEESWRSKLQISIGIELWNCLGYIKGLMKERVPVWLQMEEKKVVEYCKNAASLSDAQISRNEAIQLIELFQGSYKDIVGLVIRKFREKDSLDPLFEFYEFDLLPANRGTRAQLSKKNVSYLERLLVSAQERGDTKAISLIENRLDAEQKLNMPLPASSQQKFEEYMRLLMEEASKGECECENCRRSGKKGNPFLEDR